MTLNRILALDALTCALMGIVLILSASALSSLLALPHGLLFFAGCALLPIAIFMAALSRQPSPWPAGVRLVVLGNAAWVLASLAVLVIADPNPLGAGFLLAQAVVVALLAMAESTAARRPARIA